MSALMIVMETFLSIHVLLLISSWCIGGPWLLNKPSLKLKLARLLVVCCVLSPVAVHCIKPAEQPVILKFVALDTLQQYANQPVLDLKESSSTLHSLPVHNINTINYWELFFLLVCTISLFRGQRLITDLRKLKLILQSATPYRTCGILVIKVSPYCHIPFSVRLLSKAYIILPVSLLSSSPNVKIAIAHEGQHHRNGDCLWAYFTEITRIIFFGNPGVTRWHRVLNELQELSCDEILVSHHMIPAHDYGHCLFKVVQTVSQYSNSSEKELACTVGMALLSDQQESKFITRRICMLQKYQSAPSRKSMFNIAFAGFAIIAPLCSAYAAVGSLTGTTSKDIDTSFLDPKVQNIAAAEITRAVQQDHAKSGVIAVADPKTGKIIAFAEAGSTRGNSSWKSRIFAPGSTIKPFIAAAAIDSGIISGSKIYDCRSPYFVDGVKFTNAEENLNSVSVAQAVAKSVNVCLIKVAQDTGPVILRKKLADFGFDMNSAWQSNKSDALQLATASLGESVPVTLATLTNAYSVLANKGHLFPANSGSAISETTANSVTQMLEDAVKNGTGEKAAIKNIAVAGKTGTLVDEKGPDNTHLALFGGYAPAQDPRFVIMVVIENGYRTENGKKVMNGGALAAPVFHDMAVKSFDILKTRV